MHLQSRFESQWVSSHTHLTIRKLLLVDEIAQKQGESRPRKSRRKSLFSPSSPLLQPNEQKRTQKRRDQIEDSQSRPFGPIGGAADKKQTKQGVESNGGRRKSLQPQPQPSRADRRSVAYKCGDSLSPLFTTQITAAPTITNQKKPLTR